MVDNFSGKKLCGKCFEGQNLVNANFHGADIRGVNFTKTNLTNADFSYTISGTQYYVKICLLFVSLFVIALGGIILRLAGKILVPADGYSISNVIVLLSLLLFLLFTYFKGFIAGLWFGILLLIPALSFGLFIPSSSLFDKLITYITGTGFIVVITLSLIAISCIIISLATAVIIVLSEHVPWAVCVTVSIAMGSSTVLGIKLSTLTVPIIAILSSCIGWQALTGNENFFWIYKITIFLSSIGGTSFRNSNLTNVNFIGAKLKNADFRKSILIRTNFRQVKMLNYARSGKTYLQKTSVCQLLVGNKEGQEEKKNLDRENLRGVNLRGTNLVDASFIGADLSEACLQDADLSRAKLVQTQLDGADFTGAILTGAYIEDWGITNQTNFRGVRCEYVYMRLPTKENPDPCRKPDNREEVFADGEFGDFIKPLVDTLDLYHSQYVDPRAIAISFKQLAENYPDAELRIAGVEVRGESEDKILLRAKTVQSADKSQLSAGYFEIYNQVKALTDKEVKALMAEKDRRIRGLETMVVTALKSPSFYLQGDTVMSGDYIEGDYIQQQGSFAIGINKGEIKAEKIAGTINKSQKQNILETTAEIQGLLEQLEKSYPVDTTTGKMALATEAIAQIENNPTLTKRILSALATGGVKAFEQLLNHPAASFVIGALEDWEKTKNG